MSGCCGLGASGLELVMTEGMVIEATNPNGTIAIDAGKGLSRTYKWKDNSTTVNLYPRCERWYGSMGAYTPGRGGKIFALTEEGQQHFCCSEEVYEYLKWQMEDYQYVYTSDGLVVGWYENLGPTGSEIALHAEVWQVYIDGRKPVNLEGASDAKIRVSYLKEGSHLPPAGHFVPSEPRMIDGRWYSGKAIDLMQEAKLTPEDVESVIAGNDTTFRDGKGTYYGDRLGPGNPSKFFWVELDGTGRVVLVGR
jgi:hypothetical protein